MDVLLTPSRHLYLSKNMRIELNSVLTNLAFCFSASAFSERYLGISKTDRRAYEVHYLEIISDICQIYVTFKIIGTFPDREHELFNICTCNLIFMHKGKQDMVKDINNTVPVDLEYFIMNTKR